MIKCMDWPISVCSWSLGNDFDALGALREQTGVDTLNFAVLPAVEAGGEGYLAKVKSEGYNISATMINFPQEDYSSLEAIKATGGIVPEEYWGENKKRILDALDITVELGVKYLLMHFGFLSHSDEAGYKSFCEKVEFLAKSAREKGVVFLMETGQESAGELLRFLEEINDEALAVNFDPANMILYNKDEPLDGVVKLAGWIKHIHIKDAIRTKVPGTWGSEVVWGTGEVGGDEFLRKLKGIDFESALDIEREAGDNRLEDIKTAIEALKNFEG